VYGLHLLLIKFIFRVLLIKSIQTCLPHITHGMQYTPAKKKKCNNNDMHYIHKYTCAHMHTRCWTSMCAHAHVPVMW